ncbi:hypothetical protein IID21_00935 [Patescibacteria group bacterium]|nr:hypothetical protein [Patescibacteria group bacterium]
MTTKIKKKFVFLIVISVALYSIFNAWWVVADKTPPDWDEAVHLSSSLTYFKFLLSGNFAYFLYGYYSYYPPLVYQLMSLLYLFLGIDEVLKVFFNFLFLLITITFIYKASFLFTKRAYAAVLAISYLLFPVIIGSTKVLMLELPSAAMVSVLLYVILETVKSNKYSLRKGSLIGITSAIALLIKWTNSIFLFVPLIFIILKATKKGSLIFITALLSTTVLLSSPWYLLHSNKLLSELSFQAFEQGFLEKDPQGISSLFWYLNYYINEYLSAAFLAYFLIGMFSLLVPIIKKAIRDQKLFSFFSLKGTKENAYYRKTALYLFIPAIAIPLIVFSFLITNKDPRYLIPTIPIFMLFGIALFNINKSFFNAYLVVFFIGIFNFFSINFGLVNQGLLNAALIKNKSHVYTNSTSFPVSYDWGFSGLSAIKQSHSPDLLSVGAHFEEDIPFFNSLNVPSLLAHNAFKENKDLHFVLFSIDKVCQKETNLLSDFDYFIWFGKGDFKNSACKAGYLKNPIREERLKEEYYYQIFRPGSNHAID